MDRKNNDWDFKRCLSFLTVKDRQRLKIKLPGLGDANNQAYFTDLKPTKEAKHSFLCNTSTRLNPVFSSKFN